MEIWMWIVLVLAVGAVFCWIMFVRKEKTFIHDLERGETPEMPGLDMEAAEAPVKKKSSDAEPIPEPERPDMAAPEKAQPAPRSHDDTPETVRTSPTIGDAVEPEPEEVEADHPGDRPTLYGAPTDGPRDNLSALKGLGPAMQSRLNRLGVYYFHQIASWSDSEAEWIDAEINGHGRILREDWPAQARKLIEPDQ